MPSIVPIIDLGQEYESLKRHLNVAMGRVLASGQYILGPETEGLEAELAAYCHSTYAIGVNSGTDAVLLALRALNIGPGDEVIVPAMTFFASAEPIALLGAKPIFVDIDPATYTLDPAKVKKAITARTQAIMVVHLYGQSADMAPLQEIATARGIPIIEDMAQAIGAEYRGAKVGSFGKLACVSFFPTKNLGACGDAGAVLTSDSALAARVRRLRNHGASIKYHHEEIGYNTRLDELQAAILRVKLKHLDEWNEARIALAGRYHAALEKLPIGLPVTGEDRKHIFHLFSIRVAERDALRAHLEQEGIMTGLHYPLPLHLQPAFKDLKGKTGDFPESEGLAKETLSLPLYPQLTHAQLRRVVKSIEGFFAKK